MTAVNSAIDRMIAERDVWAEINARPSKLRPFGSALQGLHGNEPLATPPLIGRTIKPRSAGPCKVCGERRWFCDCEDEPKKGQVR